MNTKMPDHISTPEKPGQHIEATDSTGRPIQPGELYTVGGSPDIKHSKMIVEVKKVMPFDSLNGHNTHRSNLVVDCEILWPRAYETTVRKSYWSSYLDPIDPLYLARENLILQRLIQRYREQLHKSDNE